VVNTSKITSRKNKWPGLGATLMYAVQVEPYVMLRHSPLSAAATAGIINSSSSSSSRNINNIGPSSSSSSLKPAQHHLDRASVHFEGFIVDLMDRITNVRPEDFISPVSTASICIFNFIRHPMTAEKDKKKQQTNLSKLKLCYHKCIKMFFLVLREVAV